MGVRYPGRASIDPSAPQAIGVCDRCGQLYNLSDLRYQPVWAGPNILVTTLRVCTITCWDVPNEQLRTIRIPPDPWPVSDPRVENFAVDEANHLDLKAWVGKPSMFLATSSMECELAFSLGFDLTFMGVSELDAELLRGVHPAPSFEGVSSLVAELELISLFMVPFSAVSVFNGVLQRGVELPATVNGTSVLNADLELFGPVREIDLFASNTASDSATITAPASIAAGDLIVALQRARNITGIPAAAIPSGFTSIQDSSLTDTRQILSYKVAVGNEGGTSLAGMTSDVGAGGSSWAVYVFRGIYAASAANVVDIDGQMTNAAPTNQTITSATGVVPLVVFGGFGSDTAIGTTSFTPAEDGTLNASSALGGPMRLQYKIYESSPADVTVTKNDSGSRNTLQSCYIELSN